MKTDAQVPTPAVLVVAPMRRAGSPELLAALRTRAARGPAAFTVVVPATPWGWAWLADMHCGAAVARRRLDEALVGMRAAGLCVEGARIGHPDALAAVMDEVNFAAYDEVIVCASAGWLARRLRLSLAQRVRRLTGLPVAHVAGSPHRGRACARRRSGVWLPARLLGADRSDAGSGP